MNEPESMDTLVYFTNRTIGNGHIKAWVYKQQCSQCKGMMGKPKGAKGKVKIRAQNYVCNECGFSVPNEEYEGGLKVQVKYTCPSCSNRGEAEVPFRRKRINGVETVRIECSHCHASIDITKKMKEKNAGEQEKQ